MSFLANLTYFQYHQYLQKNHRFITTDIILQYLKNFLIYRYSNLKNIIFPIECIQILILNYLI